MNISFSQFKQSNNVFLRLIGNICDPKVVYKTSTCVVAIPVINWGNAKTYVYSSIKNKLSKNTV